MRRRPSPGGAIPARPPAADRALLCALRARLGVIGVDPTRTISGGEPVDWHEFMDRCQWHGVEGLVFESLGREGGIEVPEWVRSALEERARILAVRSLSMAAALRGLVVALQTEGVPFVVLKGMPLSRLLYGTISVRRNHDIDLLVLPQDLPASLRVFERMSYRHVDMARPEQRALVLRSRSDVRLVNADGLLLELHRSLDMGTGARARRYTERLVREPSLVDIGGTAVPAASLPLAIPYLGAHGTRHAWFRLFWLVDLAAIAGSPVQLDWTDTLSCARYLGQERALLLGLTLAARLLGTPMPEACGAAAADDRVVESLAQEAVWKISAPRGGANQSASRRAESLHWLLRTRRGVRAKGELLRDYLFTPQLDDLACVSLPPGMNWAYRLVRPARLVSKLMDSARASDSRAG